MNQTALQQQQQPVNAFQSFKWATLQIKMMFLYGLIMWLLCVVGNSLICLMETQLARTNTYTSVCQPKCKQMPVSKRISFISITRRWFGYIVSRNVWIIGNGFDKKCTCLLCFDLFFCHCRQWNTTIIAQYTFITANRCSHITWCWRRNNIL